MVKPKEELQEVKENSQEVENNSQEVENNAQEYKEIVNDVPEITENEYMEKPESGIDTQSEEQFEEVAPAQLKMPNKMWEERWQGHYEIISPATVDMLRYLRDYEYKAAELKLAEITKVMEEFKALSEIEKEDE